MFQHKINLPGEVSSSDVRILEQKIDLAAAKVEIDLSIINPISFELLF